MSEEPLFAYWDDQASNESQHQQQQYQHDRSHQCHQQHQQQQQQQQQQLQTRYFGLQSSGASYQSSHLPVHIAYGRADGSEADNDNKTQQNSTDNFLDVSYGAMTAAMPLQRRSSSVTSSHTNDGVASMHPLTLSGQNEQAVLQLQQNLMLILQQQKDQGMASPGEVHSTGRRQEPQHQQQVLMSCQSSGKGNISDQNFGKSSNSGNASTSATHDNFFPSPRDDSGNFYRQFLATPSEGPQTVASNKNDDNKDDSQKSDEMSPNASRLFAIGTMVQPISFSKPQQVVSSSNGDDRKNTATPVISASSLGLSESSSDFMMTLFQAQNSKIAPHAQQQLQNDQHASSGSMQVQHPGSSTGGAATAALQQLHILQQQPDWLQRHQNQLHSHRGGVPLGQQQDLQPQSVQKQTQLQQMQDPHEDAFLFDVDTLQTSMEEDNFGLPSTMLPPSVLASMFTVEKTNHHKTKAVPVKAGKSHIKERKRRYNIHQSKDTVDATDMKPQELLCEILGKRGYDKEYRFKADDSGYDTAPSPLQLASFGTHLVKAVQNSNATLLSSLLECGLSPNPCNQFRDFVLFDLVIKRSNLTIFQCLLQHGCDLKVVDGFGRTPLHHCCWASSLCRPIVEAILERDPVQIFLEDKHGQTPLEYVRTDLHGEWNDFMEEVADKYWPIGGQPPRLISPKDRRPEGRLIDPPKALPVTLASMVSSGAVSPEQIAIMDENTRKSFEN